MLLFVSIIAICFLLTIATDLIKCLKLSVLFAPRKTESSQRLQEELQKAKDELNKVLNATDQDRYVQQIRRMRAEEKVSEALRKINSERTMGHLKNYSTELMAGYALKAILYLTLAVISIKNRYNPVVTFSKQIDLQPLQGLLSFPTGVPNAISVPIWVLSCNVTFRLMSSVVKQKLSK